MLPAKTAGVGPFISFGVQGSSPGITDSFWRSPMQVRVVRRDPVQSNLKSSMPKSSENIGRLTRSETKQGPMRASNGRMYSLAITEDVKTASAS